MPLVCAAMGARDLAANLEFWADRGRHTSGARDAGRPLRPFRRRAFRLPSFVRLPEMPRLSRSPSGGSGRARPIAAAVLLAVLTGAWLIVGHQSHAAPESIAPAPSASAATPATTPTTTIPVTVPMTGDCRSASTAGTAVRCVVDAVALEVQYFSPGRIAEAYQRALGAH